ncbi:uncharacterized protein EI90DRAFT_26758 [Cantharellus anzutake]|uniref:uncharacterized protein n=1 Tax=Cantharellus anzutake TaxID=1750568 RepID=UPI001903DC3A|nr:uncharacterized protein EI90DRAFT_26758 [Cantharellus anzutake]KAF8343936.1 hypothetical protein EI90DRAFT_26758 [Cantharellus anzutake]
MFCDPSRHTCPVRALSCNGGWQGLNQGGKDQYLILYSEHSTAFYASITFSFFTWDETTRMTFQAVIIYSGVSRGHCTTGQSQPKMSRSLQWKLLKPHLPKQRVHPYATEEFSSSSSSTTNVGNYGNPDWLLEDNARYAHCFWYYSNARFHAAKQAIVDSHSNIRYPDDPSREAALESALSRFYRRWLEQEHRPQQSFTQAMYLRTFHHIRTALKEKWNLIGT